MEIEFLQELSFLLDTPSRYKVLYGGRGGGKTEGIAIALIIFARMKRLRIVCFREFQKSIKESVHSTIKQKIYDLGLEAEFDIRETSIVCRRTGSEFLFHGLRYNIDSIKSLARIDIAWCEEAKNISASSWKILGPTIRGRHESDPNGMGGPFGQGPEIWVSYNPELDDDETHRMFVTNPPPEFDTTGKRFCIVKKINYYDNKWFPADLRAEMEATKAASEDKYLEVWEGHTKQTLDGAIYAEEIRNVIIEGRRGKIPYNPSKPVHTFWDLGHNDKTAITFVQTIGVEFNIIDYYENSLKKMPYYIKHLQDTGYVFGRHCLPHDGEAETLSNVTPEKQMRDAFPNSSIRIIKAPARKFLGINAVRSVFPLCNFDHDKTGDLWQCLTRYCYKIQGEVAGKTVFSKEPDHDTPWSHGADSMQTFALSLKSEAASSKLPQKKEVKVINLNRHNTGWMGSM
jgi:phage terminase large subunit